MAVTFMRERYSPEIAVEMMPLLKLNYAETAEDHDLMPLDVNWEFYRLADQGGQLMGMIARDDGKMIGYCTYVLVRHHHFKSTMMASVDVYYLLEKYRRGWTGFRMLRAALNECRRMGANYATLRPRAKHNHAALIERLGGRLLEHVYILRLTNGAAHGT